MKKIIVVLAGVLAGVCGWAQNSDAYVVVSTVGSSGINDFVLNPAISANGVVIAGDDMVRGIK